MRNTGAPILPEERLREVTLAQHSAFTVQSVGITPGGLSSSFELTVEAPAVVPAVTTGGTEIKVYTEVDPETAELMADSGTMRMLAEAEEDIRLRKTISGDELRRKG